MARVETQPPDRRLEIAFEESQRMLANQREDLERFRTRAAGLVSVGAVSIGVIIGFGRNAHARDSWLYAGVIAFGILVVAVSWILLPRTMTFDNDPRKMLRDYVDAGQDTDSMLRWVAHYNANHWDTNERRIRYLMNVYMLAVLALACAVVALILAFVTH